jgi:hypothetical protein
MAEEAPKIQRLSRQKSIMQIQSNPLESGSVQATQLKVENLTDAVLIGGPDFDKFLKDLQNME